MRSFYDCQPMKTKAADLDYMQTAESRRRKIPSLKKLYELMTRPGMVSLAGGTPNSSIFPFDGVGSTSLAPPFANGITENKIDSKNNLSYRIFEHNAPEKEASAGANSGVDEGDIELATALQYGSAAGDDRILEFLRKHLGSVHDIAFSDWDVVLSIGNTFAWDAVLRTFCEPTDTILCEEFTFPSALENAQTRGCKTVPVKLDDAGIVPESLEAMAKLHRPKLLYMIPTGQNPTGSVLPDHRRRRVMEIARRYDFLVVEDEPYYYLQMGGPGAPKRMLGVDRSPQQRAHDRQRFLRSLVPSMLHYDTDGRVIRLDSFSKIMAPGVRMGWIVAQKRFTEAIRRTAEASSSKPSGFAQTLIYGLLKRWGQDGLVDWLMGLRDEYTERRDLCCGVLQDKLRRDSRVSLVLPQAGMFFWLKIKVDRDPEVEEETFFTEAAESRNVLVVPGHWCKVDPSEKDDVMVFRGTFASESKQDIVEGANRLADAINAYLDALDGRSTEPFILISHSAAKSL